MYLPLIGSAELCGHLKFFPTVYLSTFLWNRKRQTHKPQSFSSISVGESYNLVAWCIFQSHWISKPKNANFALDMDTNVMLLARFVFITETISGNEFRSYPDEVKLSVGFSWIIVTRYLMISVEWDRSSNQKWQSYFFLTKRVSYRPG